jgi:hypothetical protein
VAWRVTFIAIAAATICAGALPSHARAIFTRPFAREIAEVPSALPVLRGVAIDGEDNVWVAEVIERGVGELDPGPIARPSHFLKTITVSHFPTDLAIERATTGDFYTSGSDFLSEPIEVLSSAGKLLQTWDNPQTGHGFEEAHVAIDNSTEPLIDPSACGTPPLSFSECIVYVSVNDTERPEVDGVEKLNSRGEPVEFADAKHCEEQRCGYIYGNRLTGQPHANCEGTFSLGTQHTPIAVDAQGDIYVGTPQCSAVLEYQPSGEYLQRFELDTKEVPRIGKQEGRVGHLEGIRIGPASNHLLVERTIDLPTGVIDNTIGEGAIDEFNTETRKLLRQVSVPTERMDR